MRFIKRACAHDSRALAVYKTAIEKKIVDENWTTLEHQLYRRWELLAVCYLKIGDRQVSLRRHSLSYPSHIFCLPLKGRWESDEDEHLTYEDAMTELWTIVELSDEATRHASSSCMVGRVERVG